MTRATADDARWMAAAVALSERGRGRTSPNPNVGCLIVKDGRVVGRGWTQPGGRPHAEAMALAEAGAAAAGATVYVTLEPCAHQSARGPACAGLLAAARPARVVGALTDPDPRTSGEGFALLRAAGIAVTEAVGADGARRAMAGFLARQALGRPHVTLKLATSLDGRIALPSGESRWITGPQARAHAHLERARADMIVVGRGTYEADAPRLDVRLPGLDDRHPARFILTSTRMGILPEGWGLLTRPEDIALPGGNLALIEGGAGAAAAFLAADLVDRLLLYRAPILIGNGLPGIGDIGLHNLPAAHGRWVLADCRTLGIDRLEIYERQR
ncbi:diaminohydroxyphosphoribosylaminopyrimidine deaminase/5-amino-6-(5-phosphoribosylamino)uracil reductase [Sphingomonas oligoaromativorans]|nr:bifunctional diaminohydroxyphosphoribosylaminopyrimidine deaminase/5-amino-6-(5-phosphoribosylamino)uracil reductase RibD [Sphingomonas oligoaromativorans]NIJ32939.1 diaminohydroxyphosphoribosylaminopyrimidine deaminase/5-amino-6-(5-phosphoribosylamino)uracil reductase [Sphingomonas oligoaromativorans]